MQGPAFDEEAPVWLQDAAEDVGLRAASPTALPDAPPPATPEQYVPFPGGASPFLPSASPSLYKPPNFARTPGASSLLGTPGGGGIFTPDGQAATPGGVFVSVSAPRLPAPHLAEHTCRALRRPTRWWSCSGGQRTGMPCTSSSKSRSGWPRTLPGPLPPPTTALHVRPPRPPPSPAAAHSTPRAALPHAHPANDTAPSPASLAARLVHPRLVPRQYQYTLIQ